MPDCQGFSDKDVETLCKPNNRQATRASPRTLAESALPASVHAANDAAQAPVPDMQASSAGDGDTDLIQEVSEGNVDFQLETKIAARPGQRCILGACMENAMCRHH